MNLFTELEKKNINHFVTISKPAVGVFFGDTESITYTVYLLKNDAKSFKKDIFNESQDNRHLVMLELNKSQEKEFKIIKGKYDKVNVLENGHIFELKEKSFKKYYKSIL